MERYEFEELLDQAAERLTAWLRAESGSPDSFEAKVRKTIHDLADPDIEVPLEASGQVFPDVVAIPFGVEVKFTRSDTWSSVANSIREKQRAEGVEYVYLMFGKGGGEPAVKWKPYEECVVHVRTTHDPRFEVDMTGDKPSLFEEMGVSYDEFRSLDMLGKMKYVRAYSKKIHPNEKLWWFGDDDEDYSLPAETKLYTLLSPEEKNKLRGECTLLCPEVLGSGRSSVKYHNPVRYLATYRGVLTYNVRDLFSAGSASHDGTCPDEMLCGNYVACATWWIQDDMRRAAKELPDDLFVEYWGESCPPEDRIRRWLEKADEIAVGWIPSRHLF